MKPTEKMRGKHMNKYICGKCAKELKFSLEERLEMGKATLKKGRNYCVNCKHVKVQKH